MLALRQTNSWALLISYQYMKPAVPMGYEMRYMRNGCKGTLELSAQTKPYQHILSHFVSQA